MWLILVQAVTVSYILQQMSHTSYARCGATACTVCIARTARPGRTCRTWAHCLGGMCTMAIQVSCVDVGLQVGSKRAGQRLDFRSGCCPSLASSHASRFVLVVAMRDTETECAGVIDEYLFCSLPTSHPFQDLVSEIEAVVQASGSRGRAGLPRIVVVVSMLPALPWPNLERDRPKLGRVSKGHCRSPWNVKV